MHECEEVLAKIKWKYDPHLSGNLILAQHLNKTQASCPLILVV